MLSYNSSSCLYLKHTHSIYEWIMQSFVILKWSHSGPDMTIFSSRTWIHTCKHTQRHTKTAVPMATVAILFLWNCLLLCYSLLHTLFDLIFLLLAFFNGSKASLALGKRCHIATGYWKKLSHRKSTLKTKRKQNLFFTDFPAELSFILKSSSYCTLIGKKWWRGGKGGRKGGKEVAVYECWNDA